MPTLTEKAEKELQKNDTVKLNLSGSTTKPDGKLTDKDLEKLAKAIGDHPNLEELNLSDNLITDKGAIFLANAIAGHPKLNTVILSGNKIGPAGCTAIAELLKIKSALLVLDLQRNPLTDDGAEALAQALKGNQTLTRLLLIDTQTTVKGANVIVDSLKDNYVLYDVSFGTQLLKGPQEAQAKDILTKLLQRKTEVTARVNEFLIACEKGDLVKVHAMVMGEQNGKPIPRVSVQCADDKGNTGLHKAAANNQLEVLRLLLKKGAILTRNADIDKNTDLGKKHLGKNAFDIAKEKNHVAIIGELKNRPGAVMSFAKQLRRYQSHHHRKSGDGQKLNEAMIQDVERLHQVQVNMMGYLEQRMTTELDNTQENVDELKKRQAQMEQQMALMFKMMNQEQSVKLIIERFKQNHNLIIFYRTVQIKLSEIFCACRTIASGFVEHAREGDLAMAASGVELLGQVVSLIPFVGEKAKTVAGFVGGQLRDMDYEQQLNIIKAMSMALTNKEQEEVTETVARLLGQRFDKQIMSLTDAKEAKEIMKAHYQQQGMFRKMMGVVAEAKASADELFYQTVPKQPSQMIAEYATLCILELLQAKQLITPGHPEYSDKTMSVEEQLFQAIVRTKPIQIEASYNPMLVVNKVVECLNDTLSDLLGSDKLVTTDKKIWILKDFFKKPGIVTPTGQRYAASHCDVNLYDFRQGSEEEVKQLNYITYTPTASPLVVPAAAQRPTSPARMIANQAGSPVFTKQPPAAKQPVASNQAQKDQVPVYKP